MVQEKYRIEKYKDLENDASNAFIGNATVTIIITTKRVESNVLHQGMDTMLLKLKVLKTISRNKFKQLKTK